MNTAKESTLLSDKTIIYDITPFTHIDYPGKLACVAWFYGCNMRCMYCYNSDIVFAQKGNYSAEDLYSFLEKRVGLLDGVVLSGGEPTLHNIAPICKKIKSMGFSIKLDTNGAKTESIVELIEKGLIDYIALDFKARNGKFGYITGSSRYQNFIDTLKFLISCKFEFEVRTTIHPELLEPKDINQIADELLKLGYDGTYYLQEFIETKNNIADMKKSNIEFDRSKIDSPLKIVWR